MSAAVEGTKEALQRVAIEAVRPEIDAGEHPIKRTVGEPVEVTFDAFADGHDAIACAVRYRHECDERWIEVAAEHVVNDRWRASFTVDRCGTYRYTIDAWVDRYASWRAELRKRVDAGQDVALELVEGATLVQRAARRAKGEDAARLRAMGAAMRAGDAAAALDAENAALVARYARRDARSRYARELCVTVDRERAAFSAWYKVFPRSFGGLRGVRETVVPHASRLGFDVLYLLPIHPVGETKRKGRNNTLVAAPDDPGSPYAIGSAQGGHTAIDPALGTLDDLHALIAACRGHGMELALDIAFQCSPDHPWVREHPEWFRHRPDGSIRYAENPPKKYEDIYPFDMETPAWRELWAALRDVFLYWAAQGIAAFRVDNPHTKPFSFWRWVIDEVRREHPETIFLAEAFTRPKVMYELAKVGFTQSYTYFTWRTAKWELEQYLTELTKTDAAEFYRPNFWPNTPDILAFHLQRAPAGSFKARAALASTLAASWGVYAPAFELLENEPLAPGREEYVHSEKYEVKRWDLSAARSIAPFLGRLNAIRRAHPALQRDRSLTFHRIDNEQLIAYSKAAGADRILVVVNLDARWPQSGWTDLDLSALSLGEDEPFEVHDLLSDARFGWRGRRNFVRLDPAEPAHVFHVGS